MNTQQANEMRDTGCANRHANAFKQGRPRAFRSFFQSSICNLQSAIFALLLAALAPRAEAGVAATGGTVTNYTDAGGTNWTAHIFTNAVGSTSITFSAGGTVEYLIVGGGGSAGGNGGGGGGAGGARTGTVTVTATTYPIVVGAGATQVVVSSTLRGTNGGNSSVFGITAVGGGGGASRDGGGAGYSSAGGSGGGGGGGASPQLTKGSATGGYGNDGGTGYESGGSSAGGGGGGYGSVGTAGASTQGGNGGNGYWSSISGVYTGYCGGGAGSGLDYGSYGGKAGTVQTGAGGGGPQNGSRDGRPNSGGGGGGLGTGLNSGDSGGGSGGSGIVIVRYVAGGDGAIIIQNQAVTNVTTASACFNGLLSDTGTAACAVCVLWGEQNGGATWNWANTNWFNGGAVNDAWANGTPFTTNITLTGNKTYYYTYAATNAATNAVASGEKSFVTGLVTVEATTNTARYFPRTNGLYTIFRPLGCTNEAMTVYYTMSGTATNGVHYDTLPLTAQLNAGATSTVVTLAPKFGGVGTAILTLSGDYSYPTGAQSSATVTIDPSSISPYVYVVQSGSSPAEPYDSWATAANSIQTAVDYAAANLGNGVNTVIVSNGTYNISVEIAITAAISVRSFGGGVTGGMANAAATIVKVSGGSGNRRIFVVTADATVDGFTMRDAVRSSGTMLGGGVYVNSGGAVVQNCIMVNNNGDTLYGGGAYVVAGLVRNCTMQGNGNNDRAWGGGVYMTGGVVSNCVITGNRTGDGGGSGGGVYMNGGTMVACQILANTENGSGEGGGVYVAGGVLRNCLIYGNTTDSLGGGIYITGGTVESCTVVGNTAGSGGGGGIYRNGSNAGTIRNCIVVDNTSTHATYKNAYSATTTWTYNCTTLPDVAGTGCTNGNPLFRNFAEGNYQLSTGSPCIDTGDDTPVTYGTDLAGNARKQDIPGIGTASVDMGAYEYNTTLSCDFLASPRALIASPFTYQSHGPAPFTVQFTGWADGTNLTGLVYRWDFEGDNNWTDWVSYNTTSHVYNTAGVYNPKLQVTNSAAEIAEKIKSAYVSAGATHYVVTNNPAAAAPYTSWATAASNNIQAALNAAATLNGSRVVVSNGTYTITSGLFVTNSNRIAVWSCGDGVYGGLANASNTTVQRSGGGRVLLLNSPACDVRGFTIAGGGGNISAVEPAPYNVNRGSGIYVYNGSGLVRDCIIRNNGGDNMKGGGIFLNGGGTVSNCIVRNNVANQSNQGAGIYAYGGQILYCQIYDNTVGGNGGGVFGAADVNGTLSTTPVLRNCLVRNNTAVGNGGGVGGCTVESCTIVTNNGSGASSVGGGTYNSTVTDSVVFYNRTGSGGSLNYSGGTYTYSCTEPALGGNNVSSVTFVNDATGDYRLKACAAVDSGTTLSWMTGALDLAGTNRIINSIVDMGAYEYVGGALECSFGADATTVLAPANVVFTATVSGNTNGLFCWWDFGNGTTNGADLRVVTNLYSSPGVYTVSLLASNAIGEIAAFTNAAYIKAWGANAYVWTNSPSPAVPYTNWATAARLIGTAVAAAPAGVTLWVTNGTYNETVESLVYKAITVRSVEGNLSGASNTIVRPNAGGYRLFSLSHANAVLRGLAIQDASAAYVSGCGVNMSAGLARDCIIRNNGYCDNQNGGGVYMSGGTVSNCIVKSNQMNSNGNGGGIYATGGEILFCQILDNVATGGEGNKDGGGGVWNSGAAIRNCLIARNAVSPWGGGGNKGGGGVYLNAGTVESCTIVTNSANGSNGGGGVYRNSGTAGTISNSIVYFNTATASANSNFYTTVTTGIGYTCTTNPVVAGTGCISDDPFFVNLAGGDYSLRIFPTLSPCIDAGTNQAWMAGAKDLAGADRKLYGSRVGATGNPIVDMGVYETYVPPKGSVFMFR